MADVEDVKTVEDLDKEGPPAVSTNGHVDKGDDILTYMEEQRKGIAKLSMLMKRLRNLQSTTRKSFAIRTGKRSTDALEGLERILLSQTAGVTEGTQDRETEGGWNLWEQKDVSDGNRREHTASGWEVQRDQEKVSQLSKFKSELLDLGLGQQ